MWLDHCGQCAHCGMDMDMEPFCTQPAVIKMLEFDKGRSFSYGANINHAWPLCKDAFKTPRSKP
jgi:hypothetical protein